jgi:predicted component of type VI protein secretion system
VGDIISSYERTQQEQQRQKADLKKNVMLSILNSRKAILNPQSEPAPKAHPQIDEHRPLRPPPPIMHP